MTVAEGLRCWLEIHGLNVTGSSINALPNPDNLTRKVYVTDAKCQSLTDAQTQYSSRRKNGAVWF